MPQNRDDLCKRHGCNRKRTGQNLDRDCCSGACAAAYHWYREAHAIAEYLGHSDPVDEFLMATLELGKSIDRVNKARTDLRRLAREAGWTDQQWDSLKRGRYHGLPYEVAV